jgi:hypothetical protein
MIHLECIALIYFSSSKSRIELLVRCNSIPCIPSIIFCFDLAEVHFRSNLRRLLQKLNGEAFTDMPSLRIVSIIAASSYEGTHNIASMSQAPGLLVWEAIANQPPMTVATSRRVGLLKFRAPTVSMGVCEKIPVPVPRI